MNPEAIREAVQRGDTVRIETAKIEGSLRVIRDLAGPQGAVTAASVALKRVIRAHMNDNDGWVA
jgi:hypothetical protein